MHKSSRRHSANHAFSLIELAVVLAIIGILIGGTLAAKTLIRQSKMQQVISDIGKLRTAYDTFKQQYQSPPGDFTEATDQWGTDATGTCPGGSRVAKKETCNGNGDGLINTADSAASTEPFRAFQHLANQGLISGTYSGVPGSGGANDATIGLNVMEGPDQLGYGLWSVGSYSSNANWFDMSAGTLILIGKQSAGLTAAAFTTKEGYSVDLKIDDGKPATGALVAYKSTTNPGCTTLDTSLADYKLTNKGSACALTYRIVSQYSL